MLLIRQITITTLAVSRWGNAFALLEVSDIMFRQCIPFMCFVYRLKNNISYVHLILNASMT